jgi:hypothetical protein
MGIALGVGVAVSTSIVSNTMFSPSSVDLSSPSAGTQTHAITCAERLLLPSSVYAMLVITSITVLLAFSKFRVASYYKHVHPMILTFT